MTALAIAAPVASVRTAVPIASVALAAAAGLHMAAAAGHAGSIITVGFFAAVSVGQLIGAVASGRAGRLRGVRLAMVALNVGLVALWAASRTVGVSIGHEGTHREPVGLLDGLTIAAEVAAVVALVSRRSHVAARLPRAALGVLCLALAVGAAGVGGALPQMDHGHAPVPAAGVTTPAPTVPDPQGTHAHTPAAALPASATPAEPASAYHPHAEGSAPHGHK